MIKIKRFCIHCVFNFFCILVVIVNSILNAQVFAFFANTRNNLFIYCFTLLRNNTILSSVVITIFILTINLYIVIAFFDEISISFQFFDDMNILVILILIFKFSYLILEKIDFKKFKHQIAMKLQLLKDFCFDLKYLISFLPLVVSASYAAFAVVPSSTHRYSTPNENPISLTDDSIKTCLVGLGALAIGIAIGIAFYKGYTNFSYYYHYSLKNFNLNINKIPVERHIDYVHITDKLKLLQKYIDDENQEAVSDFSFSMPQDHKVNITFIEKTFKNFMLNNFNDKIKIKNNVLFLKNCLEKEESKTRALLMENELFTEELHNLKLRVTAYFDFYRVNQDKMPVAEFLSTYRKFVFDSRGSKTTISIFEKHTSPVNYYLNVMKHEKLKKEILELFITFFQIKSYMFFLQIYYEGNVFYDIHNPIIRDGNKFYENANTNISEEHKIYFNMIQNTVYNLITIHDDDLEEIKILKKEMIIRYKRAYKTVQSGICPPVNGKFILNNW